MRQKLLAAMLGLGLALTVAGCAPTGTPAVAASLPTVATATPLPPEETATPTPAPTPRADTPAEVVRAFYEWYIHPEADGPVSDYHESDYLTAGFIERVDGIRAAFAGGEAHDPILMALDVPESFTVAEPAVEGEGATVLVTTSFEGHVLRVDLVQEEGLWRIDDVTQVWSPWQVVDNYYKWYVACSLTGHNLLVDGGFRQPKMLTGAFMDGVAAALTADEEGSVDPILLAQDVPETITVGEPVIDGDTATVSVDTAFPGHALTVTLARVDGLWKIDAVAAITEAPVQYEPDTPEWVAASFYDWYIHLPAEEADAYRTSEWLTQGFVDRVSDIRAFTQPGGYDPITCSQEAPVSLRVSRAVVSGDQARLVVAGGADHAFTVALSRADGAWRIADVVCEVAPADADLDTGGWQQYRSQRYPFAISYPAGWTLQEAVVMGDGQNPTEAVMVLSPANWAGAMAPLAVEFSVGTLEQYRAVYPDTGSGETVEINGYPALRERRPPGEVFYLLEHPAVEGLRVTLRDGTAAIEGEPGALLRAVVPGIIASVELSE